MNSVDVVIVGSGFGGVAAARRLDGSGLSTMVISARPQYVFQPLLYQVATGVMSPHVVAPEADTVVPAATTVREGWVQSVDTDAREVVLRRPDGDTEAVRYRWLIGATGASQAYFGHPEFAEHSFSLKTLDDATRLRAHLADTFARAESTDDDDERARLRTFVVVGAGATGVEVAGELAELADRFYGVDVSVVLVEGLDEVLPAFGGRLSDDSRSRLENAGVEVLLGAMVTEMDDRGVSIDIDRGSATRRIPAATVVWSAGVQAAGFARTLRDATGCGTDRSGRLLVNEDLTVGDRADVFAIGDMTALHDYPGQSPVAMQEGRHVADIIRGKRSPGSPFRYFDKGSMSMINRFAAVAEIRDSVTFRGPLAWVAWLVVHLYYLAGNANRVEAVRAWWRSFVGNSRPGFGDTVSADVAAPRGRSAA